MKLEMKPALPLRPAFQRYQAQEAAAPAASPGAGHLGPLGANPVQQRRLRSKLASSSQALRGGAGMAHDLLSRRSLSAHLSYCAANFAAVGLIVGVLGYAGRLLGVSVPLYSSLLWATRLPDLVLILMLLPLVMAFVGALFGLVSYLPVHWLVRALEHNKTRRSSFH